MNYLGKPLFQKAASTAYFLLLPATLLSWLITFLWFARYDHPGNAYPLWGPFAVATLVQVVVVVLWDWTRRMTRSLAKYAAWKRHFGVLGVGVFAFMGCMLNAYAIAAEYNDMMEYRYNQRYARVAAGNYGIGGICGCTIGYWGVEPIPLDIMGSLAALPNAFRGEMVYDPAEPVACAADQPNDLSKTAFIPLGRL